MLELKNINIQYGSKCAVKDVSIKLYSGDWLVLLGANGAGKSSIIKALARAVKYSGEILLEGKNISCFSSRQYAQRVGVLSQLHEKDPSLSVSEVVRLGRYSHGKRLFSGLNKIDIQKVEQAIAVTGLIEYSERPMHTLSGGERQRAYLAQVFAQDTDILLLDEPVNSLDMKYTLSLLKAIDVWRKERRGIVISALHDLSLAACFGTRALILLNGEQLFEGNIKDALYSPQIDKAYDLPVAATMQDVYSFWEKA
jgi:iron complex transport system ATP-binding protein